MPPSSEGNAARKIVRVDLCPVEIPLTEPFAVSGGAPDTAGNVLVRVMLGDGSVGYGEAAPYEAVSGETQASTLAVLRGAADLLVGQDCGRWRALSAALKPVLSAAPAARCAGEQATVDALTRHLGLPLGDFFGGATASLVTDLTIPAGDVEHAVRSARRAAESGFGTVKVKVGASRWQSDVERVLAIADAVPGIRVVVDANAGYSLDQARQFLAAVLATDVRLSLFEQPTAAEDVKSLATLEREYGIPVCADESAHNAADVVRIVRLGGISSLNIKLMRFGVVDALDVIAMARSAGMSCTIGCMNESSVSISFSAALAAANYDTFTNVDLDAPLFMTQPVATGGITYSGETISLPTDAIGTGVDASRYFPG